MTRLFSLAHKSIDGILFTSDAVVITASPPKKSAICFAILLAPPTWPLKRLTANSPFSSSTTTAGSVFLFFISGAIVRTTMPDAMMKMKLLCLPQNLEIVSGLNLKTCAAG